MKPLVINDEAADELDEAIRYYEDKGPGIGLNLAVRVSEAFQRIQHSPQLYPFHKDTKVQRCLVRRYPFTVFYVELDGVRRRYRGCTPKAKAGLLEIQTIRNKREFGGVRGIR